MTPLHQPAPRTPGGDLTIQLLDAAVGVSYTRDLINTLRRQGAAADADPQAIAALDIAIGDMTRTRSALLTLADVVTGLDDRRSAPPTRRRSDP